MTSSLSRHPAFLSLQGGINFRDLGGQLAADGRRVRSGKLLRSGALNRLTAEDLNHLDTLPLSRVLDYRDPGEVARTPDKLSPLTHYLNAPANPPVSEVNAKVTELNAATLNTDSLGTSTTSRSMGSHFLPSMVWYSTRGGETWNS